ncbi:MAG: UPF0149 family protein [Gammaproteobacteria bacterium]|nr:UPF0149 family protein [Gammaproteobacteria bacterium]
MNIRTQEVSSWCSGFLYGFGMTGKFGKEDLSEDVSEVLSDLSRIATIADEVPEN